MSPVGCVACLAADRMLAAAGPGQRLRRDRAQDRPHPGSRGLPARGRARPRSHRRRPPRRRLLRRTDPAAAAAAGGVSIGPHGLAAVDNSRRGGGRRAALRLAGVPARRRAPLPAQVGRAALHRPVGDAQAQRAAPAPHRRSGVATGGARLAAPGPRWERGAARAWWARHGTRGSMAGRTAASTPARTSPRSWRTRPIGTSPSCPRSTCPVTCGPRSPRTRNSATPPQTREVWTGWGISPHVLSVSDQALAFCRDVLDEVCDLFPSELRLYRRRRVPDGRVERQPGGRRPRVSQEGLTGPEALAVVVHPADGGASRRPRSYGCSAGTRS